MGKQWKRWQTLSSWAPKSLQMVTVAKKLKDTCSLERKLWQTQTRPLSWWCHPTISSSVAPFSSCPQFSQHQSLFPLSKLQEIVKGREIWHAVVHGSQRDATEWLNSNQTYKRKKKIVLQIEYFYKCTILSKQHFTINCIYLAVSHRSLKPG